VARIYTRTGDDGTTGTYGKERTPKESLRMECIGTLDELNAWFGYVKTECSQQGTNNFSQLSRVSVVSGKIQHLLFNIGGILASVNYQANPNESLDITTLHIQDIETLIDIFQAQVPPLKHFVLPGGSRLNSILHITRTICRRSERQLWKFNNEVEKLPSNVTIFINRLSDLTFILARLVLAVEKVEEYKWLPSELVSLKDGV
jgi:cob(I)alamin adenosyltransferase